jgi:SAM-dependent methyltransferase
VGSDVHETAARGFSRGALEYERGRPGYPDAAISLLARELGIGPGRAVIDLAAGTGKLTRALVPLGARVVAVEPLASMRSQLHAAVPGVEVIDGTAEAIPLEDASFDVVLVAQAFHWFRVAAAASEIRRVLRPGGGLGVLSHSWDESMPWVARIQALAHTHAGDTPRHHLSPWREELAATALFGELHTAAFSHIVVGDLDALAARVSSVSYVSALEDDERQGVIDHVREIGASAADAAGRLEMPYLTRVWWCWRA